MNCFIGWLNRDKIGIEGTLTKTGKDNFYKEKICLITEEDQVECQTLILISIITFANPLFNLLNYGRRLFWLSSDCM